MAASRDRCGLVPEEGLTAVEALRLFTSDAADAIGENGSLEPGAPASFTLLGGDPVAASPDELRTMPVRDVWVEGERVEIPAGTVAWKG
jgi:predicted amidohydrolase YtcJ